MRFHGLGAVLPFLRSSFYPENRRRDAPGEQGSTVQGSSGPPVHGCTGCARTRRGRASVWWSRRRCRDAPPAMMRGLPGLRDLQGLRRRAVSCAAMTLTPFHIAVQVRDIDEARAFYGGVLGCAEGRSAPDWVDFNLYGHQFVCHLNPRLGPQGRLSSHFNTVDGHGVPVPHCGVVLEPPEWAQLAERLTRQQVEWVIEPYTRFAGTPGEQSTLFILDPSGNALEFKSFRDIAGQLFAK